MFHEAKPSRVDHAEPIDPALRLPDVMRATGLGRSSIFAAVRERRFPSPIKLSARAVGWRASAVASWLDERQSARLEDTP